MASTKQVGVSLRLKGVQVIDLVEYGSKGSMFDEEDGFEINPEAAIFNETSNAQAVEGDF